jgi:alkylation response protein AidB-like acyl-CoA dehydrogenase
MTPAARSDRGGADAPSSRLSRDDLQRVMAEFATPETLRALDREGRYPYEIYEAWATAGLLRLGFPPAYGGTGGDLADLLLVAEDLAYWSYDLYIAYAVPLYASLRLLDCGSEAQKQKLLPAFMAGSLRLSTSVSEPGAGSDVSGIRTSARAVEGGWLLNGQKLWTTAASARGNLLQVLAITDAEAGPGEGLSLFLVPNDAPGLQLRAQELLGRRSCGSCEVSFDDVFVPREWLLGPLHEGWAVLAACHPAERLLGASGCVGGAQKVVDLAVAHAREREQFGHAVGEFQVIAHMLADMQTEVDAARLLVGRAGSLLRTGCDAGREVAMAKLFASEAYARCANQGMQVFGASGYSMDCEMQRHFRDARSTTVAAGSSQMHRTTIAASMGLCML